VVGAGGAGGGVAGRGAGGGVDEDGAGVVGAGGVEGAGGVLGAGGVGAGVVGAGGVLGAGGVGVGFVGAGVVGAGAEGLCVGVGVGVDGVEAGAGVLGCWGLRGCAQLEHQRASARFCVPQDGQRSGRSSDMTLLRFGRRFGLVLPRLGSYRGGLYQRVIRLAPDEPCPLSSPSTS
jgi:hypothetical protein